MQIKNLHEGISLSVLVEGQVFELGSSGHFSFSEHGFGGGVDSFALFDQNAGSEFGNYDLGLRFSSTANTVIGLAEIYNVTSVPEPRVSALMAAGLPMLALAAIRRRRHALCQRGMV